MINRWFIAFLAVVLGFLVARVVIGDDRPVTPAEELGRLLFHDSRVSEPNTTSCGSCHKIEHGMTDGLQKAIGLIGADPRNFPNGRVGPRKTQAVLNTAATQELIMMRAFWDGRARNLFDQATGPVENPDEMGNQTKQQMVNRISNIPGYRPLIRAAFGQDRLTVRDFEFAMVAFQKRFLTAIDTPAYRYLYQEDKAAISDDAKPGAALFHKHCLQCHSGPTFTDGGFANNGFEFARPSDPLDQGLAKTTNREQHERMFRKPTLVAIAMRAPYGHNAFAKTLDRVVAHYAAGGAYLDPQSKAAVRDPKTDQRVKAIKMNATEQKQLLIFLIEAFVAYDMPRKEDIVPRTLP